MIVVHILECIIVGFVVIVAAAWAFVTFVMKPGDVP